MTDRYVDSTTGNNANGGANWGAGNAKATLAGAAAIDTAGDNIYVAAAHAESTAGAITLAWAGTLASPTRVIGATTVAAPPTVVSTAPTVTTTGTSGITWSGNTYCYGLTFNCGTGAGSVILGMNGTGEMSRFESCNFVIAATGGVSSIRASSSGGSTGVRMEWINCGVKLAAAAQTVIPQCDFYWDGGSVLAGGTSPTVLIAPGTGSGNILVQNVDLSNCAAGMHLCSVPGGVSRIVFRNMKMPAAWSGSLFSTTVTGPVRGELYNYDATNYSIWIEDTGGTIKHETTLVKSGGATNGTTSLSWKLVATASNNASLRALRTPEIAIWNDTTGSRTISVDILRDSATALTNSDIWLEVDYLGTSSQSIGTLGSNAPADPLAAAANHSSSGATWTTTGMANPNKQTMAIAVTANVKGFFLVRVVLAKASATVYVDPKVTVS